MSQTQMTETATLLLRVAFGLMFIAHSLLLKLFVFTLPATAKFFASIGLPGSSPTWCSQPRRSAASCSCSAYRLGGSHLRLRPF